MAGGEIVRYLARHGSSRVAHVVFVAATTPKLLAGDDNPTGMPRSKFEALWAQWRLDYLRVSTGRQADNDLSIPDQRRQAKGYCTSRGWEIVADYVEPGVSATDDRRPEFQRMIDAATTKPPPFDTIVVHSFSRFLRNQFQLEFYVRRLAKSGVRLVSITQELGDDPMSNMIRQIMALFDEYQSKENAKHTLRAMKENARQGFWNGACRRSATASWRPPSSTVIAPRRPWRSIPSRPRPCE
jgi:DNA invertase Pin-like site-specific DNA recombinase